MSIFDSLQDTYFVHKAFEKHVGMTPTKTAVIACDKILSYAQLNKEANQVAHSLLAQGIHQGDIVAFVLPRKSFLLSVIIGILKAGAAYLPIDPSYPQDRIQYMLNDSNAQFCITENNFAQLLKTSHIDNPNVHINISDPCYCIYTSGSTGAPKGILVTHKNVANYVSAKPHNIIPDIIPYDCNRIVSVTTVGFDIFVTESLLPLANGMEILLANEEQSHMQFHFNELLKKHSVDVIQTTPTKLKLFMSEQKHLDFLNSVKTIIIGGEVLDSTLVKDLHQKTNAKIYNIYGPAETTVWATYAIISEDDIHIGKPMANTQIYIVDKFMNLVPKGITGELCIAGDCVSAGYLNNSSLNDRKFISNPFGKGLLYKTGDLAFWREDGNIEYVGRNDFQVKIRGLRIELEEIENTISSIEGIQLCVAIVHKTTDERQLICAFYTGESKPVQEIRELLECKLPKYMVPHIFTHLDKLPLTSSGKIDRNKLPLITVEQTRNLTDYTAPESIEELLLVQNAEQILNCNKVSTLDNFFDLGGDSLKAIELASRMRTSGYDVQVKTIFTAKNIKELAKNILKTNVNSVSCQYDNELPATPAQLRIYTAQLINKDSSLYNIPYIFEVKQFDKTRFEKAINTLINRHESLRTHFENRNGEIIQVINKKSVLTVETLDSNDITTFIKPFDLSHAPLIHVAHFKNTIMIDIHHIIADGESLPIFFRELNALYTNDSLTHLPVQYGEFCMQPKDYFSFESHWHNIFSDELPVINLPNDFPRKETRSFNGTTFYETISYELHQNIQKQCKRIGITPFVYYFSCFSVLLSKYSALEDIIVAVPLSGRTDSFLNTIGMFVNTVPYRSYPLGSKTIANYLKEVRDYSIQAIEKQDYPIGQLIQKLHLPLDRRNPLLDIMFAYQSEAMTDIIWDNQKITLTPIKTTTSKCDLTFTIMPRKTNAVVMIEYCTDLFKESTIKKLCISYVSVLQQCLNENRLIKDISIIENEEKEYLLNVFNHTMRDYSLEEDTIISLFEKNAMSHLEQTCIFLENKMISYKDFLNHTFSIDKKIRDFTCGKKSVIAVIADRSVEMYISIFGIIRGGNSYLPISPDYPQERIDYILNDSFASLVLVQGKYIQKISKLPYLDVTDFLSNPLNPAASLRCSALPSDTAYIIYTSGSTGKPKGAKISHYSVLNRILWMQELYPLSSDSKILQKTPYTFDVSVWELFWWSMCGGSLVVSKPNEHFLPAKILDAVYKNNVTHLHFVPSVFDLFLNYLENNATERQKFSSVKHVFLSGEVLTASLIQRFYKFYDFNCVKLHNLYGPTECTVDVTYYDCKPNDQDPVPIGKPINNTSIYIIDKYMNILPKGVKGELVIGGINVGQGYLNNPELTAQKFIHSPFKDEIVYKTGDLAYIRADDQIIFCGRMDEQIKFNGQRIELEEIESVIESSSEALSAAVVIQKTNNTHKLVAFYTGIKDYESTIRRVCESKLPSYMIPTHIHYLEHFPLNSSGKLDRRFLEGLKIHDNSFSSYEVPLSQEEVLICEAFQRILKIQKVGRNSDFFTLGGSSLSMITLLSEDTFKNVSASDFMKNTTPARLATLLSKKSEKKYTYVESLYEAPQSHKALVLFPYAGGGVEAYTNLTVFINRIDPNMSIYYIPFLHSEAECQEAAKELSTIVGNLALYFYSHCVGSSVALQLLNYSEANSLLTVKHYIIGANIPAIKPHSINTWNIVPNFMIKKILIKAGAPLKSLGKEELTERLKKFREDTNFSAKYYYHTNTKVTVPVSLILNRKDIFTKNYHKACEIWGKYSRNIHCVYFIDSKTHYFQSKHSEDLGKIIISIIKDAK